MAQQAHREGDAVAAYKRMLAAVLDQRPSGTRQRLADALNKNRSFISQITSASYATPIPASHLETVFDICHFSAGERRDFLALYGRAHPRKLQRVGGSAKANPRSIQLPDLGDEGRNAKLHAMLSEFVTKISSLLEDQNGKGKRR